MVPKEIIERKIFVIRQEKVMLDVDLAELYGVENRALKQAVRRNMDLSPDDFLFILTDVEIDEMVSHSVIPSKQHLGGARPFAFTETGVAMLSHVLKSKKAREMNIIIMRTFVALRKFAKDYVELNETLKAITGTLEDQQEQINLIVEHLKQFEESSRQESQYHNRERLGFKVVSTNVDREV